MRNLITSNKKLLISIIIIIFLALLITALPILTSVLTQDSNNLIQDNLDQGVVSYPVSFTNENTSAGIAFVNESHFTKTDIKTFDNEFCQVPDELKYSVDNSIYTYSLKDEDLIFDTTGHSDIRTYISRNVSKNDYDSQTKELLNIINETLDGNYNFSKLNLSLIDHLFVRGCTGGFRLKIHDVIKIAYQGTDSAYMIISYGSPQAVPTKDWMPIQIALLFRKDNDYGLSVISTDEYQKLTTQNSLNQCGTTNEYGNTNVTDDSCINRILSKDLDMQKIEQIKNEWLEIFEIK